MAAGPCALRLTQNGIKRLILKLQRHFHILFSGVSLSIVLILTSTMAFRAAETSLNCRHHLLDHHLRPVKLCATFATQVCPHLWSPVISALVFAHWCCLKMGLNEYIEDNSIIPLMRSVMKWFPGILEPMQALLCWGATKMGSMCMTNLRSCPSTPSTTVCEVPLLLRYQALVLFRNGRQTFCWNLLGSHKNSSKPGEKISVIFQTGRWFPLVNNTSEPLASKHHLNGVCSMSALNINTKLFSSDQ